MEQEYNQDNIICYLQQNNAYLRRLIHANIDTRLLQYMDVDDILQELYLVVFTNAKYLYSNPQLPIKLKMRRLLMELFAKLSKKYLRPQKQGRIKTLDYIKYQNLSHYDFFEELVSALTSPSQTLIKQDYQQIVKTIWDDLPETDKEILFHRYFEQMNNLECAILLQLSESAVSNRHQRALKHVKEKLSNYPEFFLLIRE